MGVLGRDDPADDLQPDWVPWVQRLRAIAQTGLTYSQNPFDRERYHALQRLAAEAAATWTDGSVEAVLGLFTTDVGPATPKVDVRAAVFRDGSHGPEVLLVRELSDGGWTPPGGWADVGESPAEAAVREVREESGYRVRAMRLLGVLDRSRHGHPPHADYVYKILFQCKLVGGDPRTSHETDAVGFFPEDALPPLSLSRITHDELARCFALLREPDAPPDFD